MYASSLINICADYLPADVHSFVFETKNVDTVAMATEFQAKLKKNI